jgi:hypothetical protein
MLPVDVAVERRAARQTETGTTAPAYSDEFLLWRYR